VPTRNSLAHRADPNATIDGTPKELMEELATVPLLIIDDRGMRKLPPTAAEDLLELVMRRYERASTLFTSKRPRGRLGQGARRRSGGGRYAGSPSSITAMSSSAARGAGAPRSGGLARRGGDEVDVTQSRRPTGRV
jgi:hypothetical protein